MARSCLTHATGTAERDAALVLVDRLGPRPTSRPTVVPPTITDLERAPMMSSADQPA